MFSFKRASQLNTLYTQAHAQQRCYKLRDEIKNTQLNLTQGILGAYTGGYSGLQGMTGGDSGTHGMCTRADRGLHGVHGLTLGAQEMTGKTQGVTGEDIFIRTGFFLEPVVDCISIF